MLTIQSTVNEAHDGKCSDTIACKVSFQKTDLGQWRFHGLLLEQQPDFSTAQSEKKGMRQRSQAAKTRRNAQCAPRPADGQIRWANARVCRAHQFADMELTFLSIPPEKLRFVTHTDYYSKDHDGTGRTQGGYITYVTSLNIIPNLVLRQEVGRSLHEPRGDGVLPRQP